MELVSLTVKQPYRLWEHSSCEIIVVVEFDMFSDERAHAALFIWILRWESNIAIICIFFIFFIFSGPLPFGQCNFRWWILLCCYIDASEPRSISIQELVWHKSIRLCNFTLLFRSSQPPWWFYRGHLFKCQMQWQSS